MIKEGKYKNIFISALSIIDNFWYELGRFTRLLAT
jgi:hypothetical protein